MEFDALGIEHIALQVRDQQVAQDFYVRVLGCNIYRVNPEVPLVQMRFGEHLIDLLPGGGADADSTRQGVHHFCLSIQCRDIAALARHFEQMGARVEGEVRSQHGAYGVSQSLYVIDPDGYCVELKNRSND